jgi:hypothetical protein
VIHQGLFLHECMLLLALHDEQGVSGMTVPTGTALGGAVIGELLLRERVAAEKTRFSTVLVVRSRQQTGEQVIDEALERIGSAKRRASVAAWVSRIGNARGLVHTVARRLCTKGVLRADERQVLLLFRRRAYPQVDPRPERALIDRLRAAALAESSADVPAVVMLAIARHTRLLDGVLSRPERRQSKKRIEARIAAAPVAKLVDDGVRQAVQSGAAGAAAPGATLS